MTLTGSIEAAVGHYWSWRGQPIYYVRAGVPHDHQPPLLLVHGFGASTDHWRKNIAELCHTGEVWAIDLLGFGRSAKPNLEYSSQLWRDQLQDFIVTVIGRPTVLVGNSIGGYASLATAAHAPQWAAGLVLINSAGRFESPEATSPNPLREAWGRLVRSLLLQPWVGFWLFQYLRRPAKIRQTLEQVYINQAAVTDQLVADIYRPSCDRGALDVFLSVFKSPPGESNDVLLPRLQCPLMTIWGEGDPWINAQTRSAQFRRYSPALVEHFLAAGHCPHDEDPASVNVLLRDWLRHCADVAGDHLALDPTMG
ncbi:MAG: alpha/beta fold hydrolase [Spirulinaceae cyanobacterium SM2_1_0]|nr:alpha/beta fold hydrolase [Spirulinaceae cyanobacterium SM2_1_0]